MQQVVVIAAKAVDADVLSTAIYVAGENKARHLLDAYPGSKAILTRNDGSTVRL
jgi:thiamine biosynthesis lipoprotein